MSQIHYFFGDADIFRKTLFGGVDHHRGHQLVLHTINDEIEIIRGSVIDMQAYSALGELRGKGLDHRGDQLCASFDILAFPRGIFACAAAHLHQAIGTHAIVTLDDGANLGVENHIGCHDPKPLFLRLLEYLF